MSDTKAYQVQVELPNAYKIDYYTLTSVDVDPDRNPKKWTLNGYNDTYGWVELDRQTDYTFPSGYATMRFDIYDDNSYYAFLLDVEDNMGSSFSQLLKWQTFGSMDTASIGHLPLANSDFRVIGSRNLIRVFNSNDLSANCYVSNVNGMVLFQGELRDRETKIEVPAGFYVVNIESGESVQTFKVIVR